MIPRDFITEWRAFAPWTADFQVEHDLVLCRALLSIFNQPNLAESFALRGGTALSKLFLPQAARYSEDLDLVQIRAGPIGKALDALKLVLHSWLGIPQRNRKEGTVNLVYHFDAEGPPAIRLRLKIEINSREHFSALGYVKKEFSLKSRWIQGEASITTYSLDELLGTKLRALYQRRKGRDLFDLWAGLSCGRADPDKIVQALRVYLRHQKVIISRPDYLKNLERKLTSRDFLKDTEPLLLPGIGYDPQAAAQLVMEVLISRL